VPFVAGVLLLGCVALTLLIVRGRRGRVEREYEREPEVDEALERIREWVRRPAVVIAGAVVVALALVAALARNPSRWALLLLALAALGAAVATYVLRSSRRRDRG
jgi:Na+/H+ antiporter NhaD/arsenite permease-like protein